MKRLITVLLLTVVVALSACGGDVTPDYNTKEFESALNDGEDLVGKIVEVEIEHIEPDSAFGYNLQAGEHLNFVSSKNPNVEIGDTITVEVEEVDSMLGSFIITYKKR